MSTKHNTTTKKPVRTKDNHGKPQQNKASSHGGIQESEDWRGTRHIDQVNHATALGIDSVEFNLLLFSLLRPDVTRLINRTWNFHLDGKHGRMSEQPMIYFRMTIGIKLGYSRSQLAELVGNGWTITINSFIKLGYAATRKYLSRDYEDLILTAKGDRLYNDFIRTITTYISSIPEPKNTIR